MVEDINELVLHRVDGMILHELRVCDAEPIDEAGLAERVATVRDATEDKYKGERGMRIRPLGGEKMTDDVHVGCP